MNFAVLGIIIFAVSVVGGWFWAGKKAIAEKQLKIIFFVFYFWLFVFVQLGLLGLGYYILNSAG